MKTNLHRGSPSLVFLLLTVCQQGIPQARNFVKKETLTYVFSCEVCKTSQNNFLVEYLRARVLLTIYSYVIADAGNCNTTAIYSKSYTETNPSLLTASVVTMITHEDSVLECLIDNSDHLQILLSIITFIFPHMIIVA